MYRNLVAITLLLSFCLQTANAQVTFTSPGATDEAIATAPDYATDVLSDPWDMDGERDLSDYINQENGAGLSNFDFTDGIFTFNITQGADAYFHLVSPGQCGSNSIGKNGLEFPVDTSKYDRLVIRMWSDRTDGMHIVWYSGCGAITNFRRSSQILVRPGWQTYSIDLDSLSYDTDSNETRSWSQVGEVTGLRIDPGGVNVDTQGPFTRKIDWVMLAGDADPVDGVHNVMYTPTANGAADRYSLFLDDDSDPFNGVAEWIRQNQPAGGPQTVSVNSDNLFPNPYVVGGFVSDDFATLFGNPWDMNEIEDVENNGALSNAAVSNGTFSATTSDVSTLVTPNFRDQTFDGNVFRHVCIRMDVSTGGQGGFFWNGGNETFFVNPGMQTYSFDMSGDGSWTGVSAISQLLINPIGTANVNFSIEWIAVRRSGCSSADTLPSVQTATGNLIANSPPELSILQPNAKGGQEFASTVLQNPWNFEDLGDVIDVVGISAARIYPNNKIFERQGDFFCATNEDQNLDPYHPFLNEEADSTRRIPYEYSNVTVTFYQDRVQDGESGSDLRIIACDYETDGVGECRSGDDTFYKGKRWVSLTQDMTKWKLEELLHPGINPPNAWPPNSNQFRIDIEEALEPTLYCIDRVEVRKDDEADDIYTIAFALSDSDSAVGDVSVSFFYTQTEGAMSGGTPIAGAQNLPLSSNTRLIDFDTSALAAGSYYIYAEATDGLNMTRRASVGRLRVSHAADLAQDSQAPSMTLDQPTEGRIVYRGSDMVVSGWAIDEIELALVEVLIDGQFAYAFVPESFSKEARTMHPTYADASNAGFFEEIGISGIAAGSYEVKVRACDTHSNCTEVTRNVTVQDGVDPNPVSPPAEENEQPIGVGDTSLSLDSTIAKNGQLTLVIKNVDTCSGDVSILGGKTKAKLTALKKVETLFTVTPGIEAVATLSASLLSPMKKPRSRVTKSGKINRGNKKLYFATLCNGEVGPVETINFGRVKKKAVKQAGGSTKAIGKAKYLKHVKGKLSQQ